MSGECIIDKLCKSIRNNCKVGNINVKCSFLTHLIDHVLLQNEPFEKFIESLFNLILFAKPCFKITSNKWHLFGVSIPLRNTAKSILTCIRDLVRAEIQKNNKAARVFTLQITERFHLTMSQCMYDYLIEQKLNRIFILTKAIDFLGFYANNKNLKQFFKRTLEKISQETRAYHISEQLEKCIKQL